MANDHLPKKPTQNEKILYSLSMKVQSMSQEVTSLQRILYASIGLQEGNLDILMLMKTVRNDKRIQTISAQLMAAEMELQKEEKEREDKSNGSKLILPK